MAKLQQKFHEKMRSAHYAVNRKTLLELDSSPSATPLSNTAIIDPPN
jgi:hypothetical protein